MNINLNIVWKKVIMWKIKNISNIFVYIESRRGPWEIPAEASSQSAITSWTPLTAWYWPHRFNEVQSEIDLTEFQGFFLKEDGSKIPSKVLVKSNSTSNVKLLRSIATRISSETFRRAVIVLYGQKNDWKETKNYCN